MRIRALSLNVFEAKPRIAVSTGTFIENALSRSGRGDQKLLEAGRSPAARATEQAGFTGRFDPPAALHQVPIADIAEKTRLFHYQSELLESFGFDQPCVEIHAGAGVTKSVPIDLTEAFKPPNHGTPHAAWLETRSLAEQSALMDAGLKPVLWPTDMMRASFSDLLYDFLKVRLSGVRRRLFGVPVGSYQGGLDVTIYTKRAGRKVLCTPSFFFSSRQSFGATLSSPVTGRLDPGIYIFGTTDGTETEWEDIEEKVPPRIIQTVRI